MERIDVAVIGGGQFGLATAYTLLCRGLRPVALKASDRTAGSGPRYYDSARYYDSLRLFSPARCSSLPGMPFPGEDRDRCPRRDEVVAYLTAYAGGRRSSGWSGSAVCRRSRCAAWVGTRTASRDAWSPISRTGDDDPPRTGSTCVNIDACRMQRCCRCSNPPTFRVWRRAARR